MKATHAIFALALGLAVLPMASFAAPTSAKKAAAPTVYQCSKCHMKFSAALAKKDHYKDPMDGGALVPVKATAKGAKASATKSSAMSLMGM